mgnify:CR=1 FL=1
MFNVSAVGHLVADPEQKEIRDDLKLTKFRILINKKKGQLKCQFTSTYST